MNSKKVLFFLGLLNRETIGHTNEIAEMYKRALDENDDIMHLKRILRDYTYYREIGNALCKNGENLLNRIYATPTKALDILPQLKQVSESIDNELGVCNKLMHAPFPFLETITVLEKKDTPAYMSSLRMIASTCVYLMLIYAGSDSIRNLTWDGTAGIQETIYAVNTKFLPSLCNVRRPNFSWVIRRKRMGGRALFGGDGFLLNYENTRSVEVLCSGLRKEPMGTHAFLNIDAYESGECDVPLCWGIGNIVSASPDTALSFLQNNSVVTKMRPPLVTEFRRRMPTPMECVRTLAEGAMYCITPDELLLIMNQWQVGHEIEERKRTHSCLFCGKSVDASQWVCSSHFSKEL